MPLPKPEGDAPAYMALQSLPVPIPWIDNAYAVYDLIRCVDLIDAAYDAVMGTYIAEEERIIALQAALPLDAPPDARRALDTEYAANANAAALTLLTETRCQLHGINPTPVPGKPETWAHIHPALRQWLAHQGRVAARGQLQSPLAQLRPR